MTPAPTRRLLRFSLRTMFVLSTVAVLACGWLGWQIRTVETRQALAARLNARLKRTETMAMVIPGDSREWQVRPFTVIKPPTLVQYAPTESGPLPAIRRWLGDGLYALVIVRENAVCPDARRWFPEATVVELNRDGATFKGPRRTVSFGPTFR
jgi:hypothetical protein